MPHWLHSLLHWLQWGTVPAWIAAVVAVWSAYKSRRSRRKSEAAEVAAKEQAERATKAAQDAAAAATRSAEAAERSATAHETQAQLMQNEADAAERSPWRLEHHGGMDYRLRNLTNTRKYDVAVTGEPVRRPAGVFRPGGGGGDQSDVVDGGETVELDLFVAMQTRDRRVTVSWRPTPDYTGDPWTQRIGLP
ncbi:hypothetical protein [Mycobacterium persicum]|uniref:hypothetical protein n=1 Tax=Mycobacterium persicum TaxID=1487726 RepID=UPI000A09B68F|nr:hypothetical protein [Mycobacterium persicum]ORC02201.1 hypothetical protein B1T48_13960 [Mycobacterium persicum]